MRDLLVSENPKRIAFIQRSTIVSVPHHFAVLFSLHHVGSTLTFTLTYILHYPKITFWVAKEILYESDLTRRVQVMRKFVEVAAALQSKELCNLHSFIAVMAGLQLCSVRRLKRTDAAFRSRHPDLHALLTTELLPLAEPGNGIYSNAFARVNCMTAQERI